MLDYLVQDRKLLLLLLLLLMLYYLIMCDVEVISTYPSAPP
jgi:hypothetical protein